MSAGYLRRCSGKRGSEGERQPKEIAKAAAEKARKALAAKTGRPISDFSVYRCDQCLGYHVGGSARPYISRTRRAGKRLNKRMRGRG